MSIPKGTAKIQFFHEKAKFFEYFRTFIVAVPLIPQPKTLYMKKKESQIEHKNDLLRELVAKSNPDRAERRREQRKMIVYASIMNPKFDDDLL